MKSLLFSLFAGSRPQRNSTVSSPTRHPQLGAPRMDSFPNIPAGSESCPGLSPFRRAGGPAPPASSHWVRPVQAAPSSGASARFWPRSQSLPHGSLQLLARPAGDFQKGLPDHGPRIRSGPLRVPGVVGRRAMFIPSFLLYSPMSRVLTAEVIKSGAQLSKNLAIAHRGLTRHLALCFLEAVPRVLTAHRGQYRGPRGVGRKGGSTAGK